jgi:hypothetical protein
MRHRLALGLLAALSLLVAACGAAAGDAPALGQAAGPVATQPVAASAPCPTTRPPDPLFVPPAPYPPEPPSLYGDKFWYGSNELWTWLDADGTWAMPKGLRSDKSFWWRQGYDWRTETTPALSITGRRLDGPAPAVTASDATNGFREQDIGAFMLLGLELPAGGCWELTGHYHGRSLRFVVRVS